MPRWEFSCHKCRHLITDWTVDFRPTEGRIILTANCHGETETRVILLDHAGVMFSGEDIRLLPSREPRDYLGV